MEQNQLRWLIGGIILLALAGYNFATYTTNSSFQSTFTIPGGHYQYIARTLNSGDSVSGTFQETSGNIVSYYILSSEEYSTWQTGVAPGALYYIEDVSSGSISYGFTTHDQYYFIFRHGTGLENTTETVTYQRTYTTHDNSRLYLGILFSIAAAVEIVIGFRRRKPQAVAPTFIPAQQGQAPTWIPQFAMRKCPSCGQIVDQSATFCPSCGTKLADLGSGSPGQS